MLKRKDLLIKLSAQSIMLAQMQMKLDSIQTEQQRAADLLGEIAAQVKKKYISDNIPDDRTDAVRVLDEWLNGKDEKDG